MPRPGGSSAKAIFTGEKTAGWIDPAWSCPEKMYGFQSGRRPSRISSWAKDHSTKL